MQIPESIKKLISDEEYRIDDIGLSGSSVLVFRDKVLKIQPKNGESENEYRIMSWLGGKIPVPEVIGYETHDDLSFLLMSRCEGEMSCSDRFMRDTKKQVKLLADALKTLWSVDISDCPSDMKLEQKLSLARYNVEHGLVDTENVQPDTFGENGFKNPEELLKWLYENCPREELTLSHGDFSLPNIFLNENGVAGYIDLGKTGAADKWCDIALCYRSLSNNYAGRYSGQTYSGLDDLMLFKELGIEPDWEKIRYYILLDELF